MELARHVSVLEQAGDDSVQTDAVPSVDDVQLKVTPLVKGSGSRVRSAAWATGWAMIAAMIGCLVVGRGYLLSLPPSPVAKNGVGNQNHWAIMV